MVTAYNHSLEALHTVSLTIMILFGIELPLRKLKLSS